MAKRKISTSPDSSHVSEKVGNVNHRIVSNCDFKSTGFLAHQTWFLLSSVRRLARKRRSDKDSTVDVSGLSYKVHICSNNNFPTAAGLASSAAGYACLGKPKDACINSQAILFLFIIL